MHEVSELTAQHLAEQNMLAYYESHDISYVAEDAVFRNLSTGEVYTGRAEIGAMLHYIYHVAFDAKVEKINYPFRRTRHLLKAISRAGILAK